MVTLSLLALVLMAGAATPSEITAGKKLLDQAITAAGGAKALDGIQDVTMTGTVSATVAEQDVEGTAIMTESRDGSTRDEMTLAGFEIISSAGPKGGFTTQMGVTKPLSGIELKNAQAQSRFTPLGLLLHGAEPGVVLRGRPQEGDLDVLEVDPDGAEPIVFYFDAKTHLVSKVRASSNGSSVVTNYSLHLTENGVKLPHRITVAQSGLAMTLNFDTVSFNTATAVSVASATPAAAATSAPDAMAISVVNHSKKTLGELHLSPHGKKDWGANLLSVDRFHDGDTATVRFVTNGACEFDVMTADLDGNYAVAAAAVDLCKQHSIEIAPGKRGATPR